GDPPPVSRAREPKTGSVLRNCRVTNRSRKGHGTLAATSSALVRPAGTRPTIYGPFLGTPKVYRPLSPSTETTHFTAGAHVAPVGRRDATAVDNSSRTSRGPGIEPRHSNNRSIARRHRPRIFPGARDRGATTVSSRPPGSWSYEQTTNPGVYPVRRRGNRYPTERRPGRATISRKRILFNHHDF